MHRIDWSGALTLKMEVQRYGCAGHADHKPEAYATLKLRHRDLEPIPIAWGEH